VSNLRYPDEFEELEFDVVEEHWNEYHLNEGNCRIRGRVILRKIISDPNNPDYLAFDFAPVIFDVYAPLSSRGERDKAPRPDEYERLPSYEVRIESSDEKYNRYRILKNDRIIKIRLLVSEVTRIKDRFDANGTPFYLMTYSYDVPQYKSSSKGSLVP
jgi:hypothetical protein